MPKCNRPLGIDSKTNGLKTCATHTEKVKAKNASLFYLDKHSYYPYGKPDDFKEVYDTNEFGEGMLFDGEWFNHDDCGRVKIVPLTLPFPIGVMMIDDGGDPVITNPEEIRKMLNMLHEAGATL
jgi:hypothetical protein